MRGLGGGAGGRQACMGRAKAEQGAKKRGGVIIKRRLDGMS